MRPRDEQESIRHAEECLAKAAYCAWVAQTSGDPEMRRYLEGLARRWSQKLQLRRRLPNELGRTYAGKTKTRVIAPGA